MIKSVSFPDMLSNTYTNTCEDKEATKQNIRLLLLSEQGSLFGDPEYGVPLKGLTFDQNDTVLADLLKDSINTAIALFIPQVVISMKDIAVEREKGKSTIYMRCINQDDFTTDLYSVASLDR